MNEKIKASEVHLTGLHNEDLGIVSREEALALAKMHKADLVCTSLFSSPPPCRLIARGQAKQEKLKKEREERKSDAPLKIKEFRLTVHIEEHDYETKISQMSNLLKSGKGVQLVVRISGKEGEAAKKLLERMVKDLSAVGAKETGIQLSGKQATLKLLPL